MKFFSLLYQGDVHVASGGKVIPAKEFSLLLQAKELLDRAKTDAASYKKKVEEECETLKKEAKEKGFTEGLSQFNEHLATFEKELKKLHHEMHLAILPLALKA
ncbi:MAG: HrpE/YscL family type III secretion apparatus protein, partial [Anaerolineae bacterium]